MKKIILMGIFLFFIGCSNKNYILFQQDTNTTAIKTSKKQNQTEIVYEYKIMPGDILSITIYNHPELSTASKEGVSGIEVYKDGTIMLPLIGKVKIAGLTKQEATLKLQKLYAQYLKKPYVSVNVLNKKIYVLGEVKSPGTVPLMGDYTNLIDVISQKGGFTDMARRDHILIISGGLKHPVIKQVDLTKISSLNYNNLILKPNDIVYVQPVNIKPLDVKVQGYMPILNFINTLFGTFANIKYISK
ncbi:polysaccharide export protein [Caminibacter mediatlanticus TB-2]|uniref:Polysaccharide export protein n=1 Tax=Caminibacter mediatlanticus TB-2 TaxID=391592 RepID=A0AAI9AGB2_9BACT|nr:polysaccharide biosynthesis/export family protein [Caminibacter mediatlanticus]EDM22987.1 polysaccharide export protein [Caminibacter mediatlanticus TB-2]QCT93968.1 polysaccharide export protein [Caminibacter mediatlanticus TB-2]